MSVAQQLASWAAEFSPQPDDQALARRSLLDTVAVAVAGQRDVRAPVFDRLGDAGRLAALAHVLDFDDLHMPSTTHISAVCVPVALACGGGARAYLAGAGVMARLGTALGWRHYDLGWHATCTAGALGAAVTASVARGLDAHGVAVAMALAVPAAGGVQRAFGTTAKSLQVGFAADAGVRAADLVSAGAGADPRAVDDWLSLVGGSRVALQGPAVPDGLAIKLFPCCYALQRPIAALLSLGRLDPQRVSWIGVRTPTSSMKPLIHRRPATGLEGKFSLEYGLAAAVLDGWPGIESFTDQAVRRPAARRLVEAVEVIADGAGDGLLSGQASIEVESDHGSVLSGALELPPGAPGRPPSEEELARKVRGCAGDESDRIASLTWDSAHQTCAYLTNRGLIVRHR